MQTRIWLSQIQKLPWREDENGIGERRQTQRDGSSLWAHSLFLSVHLSFSGQLSLDVLKEGIKGTPIHASAVRASRVWGSCSTHPESHTKMRSSWFLNSFLPFLPSGEITASETGISAAHILAMPMWRKVCEQQWLLIPVSEAVIYRLGRKERNMRFAWRRSQV